MAEKCGAFAQRRRSNCPRRLRRRSSVDAGAPSLPPISRKHGPSLQSLFRADQQVLLASSLGRRGLHGGQIAFKSLGRTRGTYWSVRMRKTIRAPVLFLLVMGAFGGTAAQSPSNQPRASGMETDVAKVKEAMLGNWESIAPEIRPSKNPDGSLKPFYLKRSYKYLPSDRFELEIVNSADPYGAVPLARIKIGGHMLWQGPHPIAPGAQKVDFVADESYEVTPLAQGFADVLNKVASDGCSAWAVNTPQSVFGKSFVPFGLKAGTNFMEYDLVYLRGDMLFWGARNIDGRGFDVEQNRPTNLQIPLIRK